jgi:uncharacterized protein (DUF885 family)
MGSTVTDNQDSAGEALAALADRYWNYELDSLPTTALVYGDYRNVGEWEDLSADAESERAETLLAMAARAEAIDPGRLDRQQRVTRAVLIEESRQGGIALQHTTTDFEVDPSGGVHVALPQMAAQLPIPDADVADAIIAKWAGYGAFFDATIARLRAGLAAGRVASQTSITKTIAQLEDYLASDITDDPYALLAAPEDMSSEEVAEWRTHLVDQVSFSIRPGYERYRDFLRDELLPDARSDDRPGVMWVEGGVEVYRAAVRRHTTLELEPEDVHAVGLEEIERLDDEYRALGLGVLGTSDLSTIYDQLRNDPDLRFETAVQVRDAAQTAMDRALAAMGDWFGRLPQADCVMAEIPGPGAEDAPLGYYLQPALDGTRPGTFFINTTEPTTRTRYESEALAFHESIPGHHLQIAIAQELDAVPDFQKNALVSAYVEGWGLYTERLSDEMGLYTSDLTRLGILSFDSWRCGRLVVDTGLHAMGWSRQQAIDYLLANSPQALNNIENEVDRYIAWPGQALAYKIGQLEILRLRREAERARSERFDIKGFHDTVLGSGPVTLQLLGELVADWAHS